MKSKNSKQKKYYIKIVYDTGDSFSRTYDVESEVTEVDWDNLDNAKMNLKWLEEHYDVYLKTKDFGRMYYSKEEINEMKSLAEQSKWYNKKYPDVSINMFNDNNETVQVGTFWTGYFESLKSAEVCERIPERNDMRYEPNRNIRR